MDYDQILFLFVFKLKFIKCHKILWRNILDRVLLPPLPMHHMWWCVGWVGMLGDANFLCTLASPFVFLSILTPSESSFSISLYNWFLVLAFPKGCSCEPYILWSPRVVLVFHIKTWLHRIHFDGLPLRPYIIII